MLKTEVANNILLDQRGVGYKVSLSREHLDKDYSFIDLQGGHSLFY
jgi:hypothetical protein